MKIIITNGEKMEVMDITENQLEILGKSIRNDWEAEGTKQKVKQFVQICVNTYWGE